MDDKQRNRQNQQPGQGQRHGADQNSMKPTKAGQDDQQGQREEEEEEETGARREDEDEGAGSEIRPDAGRQTNIGGQSQKGGQKNDRSKGGGSGQR